MADDKNAFDHLIKPVPKWLGQDRYEELPAEKTDEIPGLRGPLRGVRDIEFGRLARALRCVVTPYDGFYHVIDPDGRNVREGKDDGQWVNLDDPQATRCHCEDFLLPGGARGSDTYEEEAGEGVGRPCKHILAAVLADPVHKVQLAEFVTDLRQRDAVAAAVDKPQDDAA